jgi:hypothetical protein
MTANLRPPGRVHHRVPIPQRLSRQHRRWFYLSGSVLALSGVGWLASHFFLRAENQIAGMPHPSEPWWLRVHGAAMIGFLIVFGALLPGHIARGWRGSVNKRSGIIMILLVGLLIVTGYGLYYVVDDGLRANVSLVHWSLGLASIGGVFWHVTMGRASRR